MNKNSFDDNLEEQAINNKKYYVQPQKFREEYASSELLGKPTERLMNYFNLIATKYSNKYNNLSKLDQDACINYAVTEAWLKWKEYDRRRSDNIFAFFTEMIKNDLTIHYNYLRKNSKRNISIDVIYNESKK